MQYHKTNICHTWHICRKLFVLSKPWLSRFGSFILKNLFEKKNNKFPVGFAKNKVDRVVFFDFFFFFVGTLYVVDGTSHELSFGDIRIFQYPFPKIKKEYSIIHY